MLRKILLFILLIIFINVITGSEIKSQQTDFKVFQQRRQILCDSLKEGVAVLYSTGEHTETGYRADANFYYLTGIDDPNAILLLAPGSYKEQFLFLMPRDAEQERWIGNRPAITDSLKNVWMFDFIWGTYILDYKILSLMKETSTLHLISSLKAPSEEISPDLTLYQKIMTRVPHTSLENSTRFLDQMRMIKSEEEINAIEKAIEITHKGITDLLAEVKPGITEFQLDGIIENSFKRQGAQNMAFPPIVGFGEKGAILHYEKRNQTLEAGKLLLLDVGAEWNHYSADISRTIPVDGKFNERQAELYDLILKAHDIAIATIKPGVYIHDIQEAVEKVFKEAGYIDYFLHGISHHIGLDVHDVSNVNVPLLPGMVITVEPGLYIDDEKIGIRLEDDVIVTENGCRILSEKIPIKRDEVENWVKEARSNQ